MSRAIPADRFDRLAQAAIEVFIRHGYRRTQMSDVADVLGVAKGTLYLYVESKEALFDLAIRSADRSVPLEVPARLPLPTPEPGSTVAYARTELAQGAQMPQLLEAIASPTVADLDSELDSIVREIPG